MAYVAGSSLWISEIQLWGRYSPIHFLSVWTLGSLVFAVAMVRRGNFKAHRRTRLSLFFLALVVTGLFTLMSGRVMNTSSQGARPPDSSPGEGLFGLFGRQGGGGVGKVSVLNGWGSHLLFQ